MKILITNDDGIFAEGIRVIADWAKQLGEVTVVAPKAEQSGKSHGIEIHKPFEVTKVDFGNGITAISVDSTPADCVRYATAGLGEHFDLVVSGVNCGFNIGADIVYSATCGAIFEAAYAGIPAIAVSTDRSAFDAAREHIGTVYTYIVQNQLFSHNHLYNINIPLHPKGIRITKQGGPYFRDHFRTLAGNMCQADGYSVYENSGNLKLDTDAVMNGYISVTPLTVSRTAHEAYEKLSSLSLNRDI